MRKYQPIWLKLKVEHVCFVQVHRLIAPRVVKAVIKEKDRDAAYKIANPLDKAYIAIERIPLVDGKTIRLEFRLKQRFGLVPLVDPGKQQLQPEEVGL